MEDSGKYQNELAKKDPNAYDGLQRALIIQARKHERAFRGCDVLGVDHEYGQRVTETLLAFDKDHNLLGELLEYVYDPKLFTSAPGIKIDDLYRCIHCDAPAPDGFDPIRDLPFKEIVEEISIKEFRKRYPYFT